MHPWSSNPGSASDPTVSIGCHIKFMDDLSMSNDTNFNYYARAENNIIM